MERTLSSASFRVSESLSISTLFLRIPVAWHFLFHPLDPPPHPLASFAPFRFPPHPPRLLPLSPSPPSLSLPPSLPPFAPVPSSSLSVCPLTLSLSSVPLSLRPSPSPPSHSGPPSQCLRCFIPSSLDHLGRTGGRGGCRGQAARPTRAAAGRSGRPHLTGLVGCRPNAGQWQVESRSNSRDRFRSHSGRSPANLQSNSGQVPVKC